MFICQIADDTDWLSDWRFATQAEAGDLKGSHGALQIQGFQGVLPGAGGGSCQDSLTVLEASTAPE